MDIIVDGVWKDTIMPKIASDLDSYIQESLEDRFVVHNEKLGPTATRKAGGFCVYTLDTTDEGPP